MMKKFATIFVWALFALSLFLTTGCGKEDPPDDSYTGKLISRIDVYYDDPRKQQDYMEFTYDANNRLVKEVYKEQLYTYIFTLSYINSTTIIINNNSSLGTQTATLNSAGYIIKVVDEKGNVDTELFYENGYLIKNSRIDVMESYFTWENENQKTEQTIYDNVWRDISTSTYTYSTALNNQGNLDINLLFSNVMRISPFGQLGKASKNRISQIDYESEDGYKSSEFIRYETDADGYVTQIYARENDGAEYLKFKFTYK